MEKALENGLNYEEVCVVVEEYDRFIELQREYFCNKVNISANDTQPVKVVYTLSPQMDATNREFFRTWPERKINKMEKIKTGKYTFSKGKGRRRDEIALAKNNHKYQDLLEYFELEMQFGKMQEILGTDASLEEHIDSLRELKAKLEKKANKPKGTRKKPETPNVSQKGE